MKYRTFQEQFHDPIRTRAKLSTIRGTQWCEVGERVALKYWRGEPYKSHQGTIATAVVDLVMPVVIHDSGVLLGAEHADKELLARQEGFASWVEMHAWFSKTYGLPYSGVLTRWQACSVYLHPVTRFGGIDVEVAIAMDDSCQEQYYARGHYEPAQFLATIAAYRHSEGRRHRDLDLAKIRQTYWRTVRAGAEEDSVNFGEGFKFIESTKGPGAYPVTLYDDWLPMHDFVPSEQVPA
jgi:hypothetical protein